MAIVNRGFKGRRRQAGAGLIPPGQYVVDDFPVLTAGPTPFTSLEDWDFTIVDETGAPAVRSRTGATLACASSTPRSPRPLLIPPRPSPCASTFPTGQGTGPASTSTYGSRPKTATRPNAATRSPRHPAASSSNSPSFAS